MGSQWVLVKDYRNLANTGSYQLASTQPRLMGADAKA